MIRVWAPVLVVLAICLIAVYQVTTRRQQSAPTAPSALNRPSATNRPADHTIEQADYRNHLGMARWIEARLGDDLVRSALDPKDDERARKLLQEFYGDET